MKKENQKWENTLTIRHFDILSFIKSNGVKKVELAASNVNQNKNFYARVKKLEYLKLITVQRFNGMPSLMTLTDLGLQVYDYLFMKFTIERYIETNRELSEEKVLISIINNSNISTDKKNLITRLLV